MVRALQGMPSLPSDLEETHLYTAEGALQTSWKVEYREENGALATPYFLPNFRLGWGKSEGVSMIPILQQRTPCADKNDRLGWNIGLSLAWEGLLIGIRTNRPQRLLDLCCRLPAQALPKENRQVPILLSLWEGPPATRPGVRNYHLVYNGWQRVARTLDLEEAMQAFEREFWRAIRAQSRLQTYLEARVVERGDQSLLLLPQAGGLSVVACLDGLRARGWKLREQPYVQIQDSGACPATPVTAVARLSRSQSQKSLIRLSPGETALQLLPYTCSGLTQARSTLQRLARLSQQIPGYQVRTPSARRAAEVLHRQFTLGGCP